MSNQIRAGAPPRALPADFFEEWNALPLAEQVDLGYKHFVLFMMATDTESERTKKVVSSLQNQITLLWWALIGVGCYALWLSWR